MTRDVSYGEMVQQMLDESSIWANYRDQRHDLFLTNETVRHLLTGPTTTTKGYLMGPSAPVTLPTAPPPMDD